jgi:hypothetical protein
MATNSSKSMCSNEIHNIFGWYEDQICSDSDNDDKSDSSDSGLSNFHDTALGETIVSETDIKVENEGTAGIWLEVWTIV